MPDRLFIDEYNNEKSIDTDIECRCSDFSQTIVFELDESSKCMFVSVDEGTPGKDDYRCE